MDAVSRACGLSITPIYLIVSSDDPSFHVAHSRPAFFSDGLLTKETGCLT